MGRIFKWFLRALWQKKKKDYNFLLNWSQEKKKKNQSQDLRLLFDHKTSPVMIIIIDIYEALSMCSGTSLSTLQELITSPNKPIRWMIILAFYFKDEETDACRGNMT